MNNERALTKLWAWQHWYRTTDRQGRHYGLSFLKKGFDSAPKSLHSDSRNTVRRLNLLGKCIGCDAQVPASSTGDHIIPLSRGGPQSIENFAPLCRSCNSSKGDRDLLEWWIDVRQRTLGALNLDALCVYLRLMYQMFEEQDMLQQNASDYCEEAVQQAAGTLPSELRSYFENQTTG